MILIRGGLPTFSFFGTINNATATTPTGNGPIISIGGEVDPSTGIPTTMTGATIIIGGPELISARLADVLLGSFPQLLRRPQDQLQIQQLLLMAPG